MLSTVYRPSQHLAGTRRTTSGLRLKAQVVTDAGVKRDHAPAVYQESFHKAPTGSTMLVAPTSLSQGISTTMEVPPHRTKAHRDTAQQLAFQRLRSWVKPTSMPKEKLDLITTAAESHHCDMELMVVSPDPTFLASAAADAPPTPLKLVPSHKKYTLSVSAQAALRPASPASTFNTPKPSALLTQALAATSEPPEPSEPLAQPLPAASSDPTPSTPTSDNSAPTNIIGTFIKASADLLGSFSESLPPLPQLPLSTPLTTSQEHWDPIALSLTTTPSPPPTPPASPEPHLETLPSPTLPPTDPLLINDPVLEATKAAIQQLADLSREYLSDPLLPASPGTLSSLSSLTSIDLSDSLPPSDTPTTFDTADLAASVSASAAVEEEAEAGPLQLLAEMDAQKTQSAREMLRSLAAASYKILEERVAPAEELAAEAV